MDNNALACGPKWVEDILKEMRDRSMKVDFNQGLDCRIFSKDEVYAKLFKKYSRNMQFIRFSWDAANIEPYALKTIHLLNKYGLNAGTRWLMLMGNGEEPSEVWGRMKALLGAGHAIKPMLFRDLVTGEKPESWANYLHWYVALLNPMDIMTPGLYRDGVFGRDLKGFMRCLELGKRYGEVRNRIGRSGFGKAYMRQAIEYVNNGTKIKEG